MNSRIGRRQFLQGAAGLGAVAVLGDLAGCSSSGSKGGASSGQKTVSFMLDYLPNPDDLFVQVAKDQGYLADAGINLKTTVPPSNLELVAELVGRGQYDMGVTYAVDVTAARAKGIPVVSVAGAGIRADGLISLAPHTIHSGHDLVGKTVASYAAPDYLGFITSVMRSAGLKVTDCHLTDVAFTPPVIASGKAFAGAGLKWGEYIGTQEAAKVPVNFISFFEPQFGIPAGQPYLSFITSEDYANKNPAIVKSVVTACMRGIKKSLVDPSIPRPALQKWCSSGPNAVGTVDTNVKEFDALRPYWFSSPTTDPNTATYAQQDLAAWSTANEWLHSVGGVDKLPAVSSYVVNDFLTSAATNPSV